MRELISRLIAPFIAAFVLWLGHYLPLGPEFQQSLSDVVVLFIGALFTAIYGVFHKIIDKKTNPLDAASGAP